MEKVYILMGEYHFPDLYGEEGGRSMRVFSNREKAKKRMREMQQELEDFLGESINDPRNTFDLYIIEMEVE